MTTLRTLITRLEQLSIDEGDDIEVGTFHGAEFDPDPHVLFIYEEGVPRVVID